MEDGTLSTYDATDNFTNSCMSRSGQSEEVEAIFITQFSSHECETKHIVTYLETRN